MFVNFLILDIRCDILVFLVFFSRFVSLSYSVICASAASAIFLYRIVVIIILCVGRFKFLFVLIVFYILCNEIFKLEMGIVVVVLCKLFVAFVGALKRARSVFVFVINNLCLCL